MPSLTRCRFTPGFHRASVKPLSVSTRPFTNDSGGLFALARSRLSSRHGAAPREVADAPAEAWRDRTVVGVGKVLRSDAMRAACYRAGPPLSGHGRAGP